MKGDEPITVNILRRQVVLAEFWDTLGWVHFQRSELDEADKFITAAWSADARSTVADHLGQIYERCGQQQQAIHAFALALAAGGALPETRLRLAALVPAAEIDQLIAQASGDLVAMRTLPAGRLIPDKATAQFDVVQTQKPERPLAQFIRGDHSLRPFTKAVEELTPAGVFPETSIKMTRLVNLTCPGQGGDCSIELLPASAAVFAELNSIPPDTNFASVSHIGRGVTPPVPIYKPEPQYSKQARKNRIQGAVVLKFVIDPTGHPRDIKVLRGLGYGLDEKAIECAAQWEFRPGMKDGQPVPVTATIAVNFSIKDN
jgi:TonB family protein